MSATKEIIVSIDGTFEGTFGIVHGKINGTFKGTIQETIGMMHGKINGTFKGTIQETTINPMQELINHQKQESTADSLSISEIESFSKFAEKHFIEVHTRNSNIVYRSVDLHEQNLKSNSLEKLNTKIPHDIDDKQETKDDDKPLTSDELNTYPTDVPIFNKELCLSAFIIDSKYSLEHIASTLTRTFTSVSYIKLKKYSPKDCEWKCYHERNEKGTIIKVDFCVLLYKNCKKEFILEMQRLSGDVMKFFSIFTEIRRYFGEKTKFVV